MLKKEYTLADVVEYFKENQIPSFEEEIDEYGGYFITAARIAAVILAPSPIIALANFCSGIDAASLRVSKLFSWLTDKVKYGNKGREKFAIHRFELSSIIYVKLLGIAISNAFKDEMAPALHSILVNIDFESNDKEELRRLTQLAEASQLGVSINTFAKINKEKINEIIDKTINPILPFLISLSIKCNLENNKKKSFNENEINVDAIKKAYVKKSYTLFNAFLINFSSEFPEFGLWCDLKNNDEILKELSNIKNNILSIKKQDNILLDSLLKFEKRTKVILKSLESLKNDEFLKSEGFPSFDYIFDELFKIQTESILESLDEKIKNNIKAHHKLIKNEIDNPLSENKDIAEIIYPKNFQIYIAQSFQHIIYNQNEHRKLFLTTSSFDVISKKGEDVAKFLLKAIVNPNSILFPIIILGNPGAGKSMFSKMFAAKLCDTNDYIPFLIRLRDVASSSSDISEHINKGIAKSIGLTQDINWLEWAKLFKTRIPIILLDGFDELMQSSDIQLNGYINAIRDLQMIALSHDICVRIILTSRIAVMQDVTIPNGTIILKLNPFDSPRKDLWIDKWNSFQIKKEYKFVLPENNKILELSQEPLLLFMLAIYDFPASELQTLTKNKSFNQSKLYDSLLTDFGLRQLEKEDAYRNGSHELKRIEEELFRLRLGMISHLMFLNDTTNKDIRRLDEELKICKLDNSKIKPIDVLTGFFFVHQNKSTSENEFVNYNYEFLHKSFGEFLAADFLLRIAYKQKDRKSRDMELFKFCYGYNWLHKHPEIQRFLFEHTSHVFDLEKKEQDRIIEEIQDELNELFEKTINDFPISRFTIVEPKSKIEHLAIYSQNLIFLWLSLNNVGTKVYFDILEASNNINISTEESDKDEAYNYVSQDRQETIHGKLLWKRIASLWQLVNNYHSVAKLNEWIEVSEEEKIILTRRKEKIEISNNFLDASIVACNDFNFVLSMFDIENKLNQGNFDLKRLEKIVKKKPELIQLSNDAIIYRLSNREEKKKIEELFIFLLNYNLNSKQIEDLTEKFILLSDIFPDLVSAQIGEKIFLMNYETDNIYSQLKLLKYLLKYRYIDPVYKLFKKRDNFFEQIIYRWLDLKRENKFSFVEPIKLINEISNEFQLREFFNHKVLDVIIHRFSLDLRYLVQYNPQIALEYVKIIKNFGKAHEISDHLNPSIFEDILETIYSEIINRDSEDTYLIIEYIKIVNELSEEYQKKQFFIPKVLDSIIHKFSKYLLYLVRDNPQIALEYLKIIKNFGNSHEIREYLNQNIFEEILETIYSGMRGRDSENPYFTFEYLKIINKLSEDYQVQEIFLPKVLDGVINRFIKDLRYLVRDNPQIALEYVKIIKNFGKSREIHEYLNPNIFEEIFEIICSEINSRDSENPYFTIEHIKIINELSEGYQNREIFHIKMLDKIIHSLSKEFRYLIRDNPQFALEFFKIIYKQGSISLLFDEFPHLKNIYEESPNGFNKYFESFIKIFQNESSN